MMPIVPAILIITAFLPLPSPDGRLQAAGGPVAPSDQIERVDAARSLVPLLNDLERRMSGRLRLEPGTLPPSPFSGGRSTLFAFKIVEGRAELDDRVVRAIERLRAWAKAPDPAASEAAELADTWMDHLLVTIGAFLPTEQAAPGACDAACTAALLLKPGESFGRSRAEREEARDWVLAEALAAAVEELGASPSGVISYQ